MSRIPAPSAIVATTTISVVLAICMLGGVGTAAPAGDSVAPLNNATISNTLAWSDDAKLTSGATATELGDTVTLVAAPAALTAPAAAPASAPASVPTISLGLAIGVIEAQAVLTEQVPVGTPVVAAPAPLPAVSVATPVTKVAVPAVLARLAAPLAVVGAPRQMARAVAVNAGLSDPQWTCLDELWQRESKFQTTVRNPRSGAYGIPQALPASRMASAGADWRTNPVTQIKWGLSYIDVRYGSACNAWSHWVRYGWY
jgi:hypothetical protein